MLAEVIAAVLGIVFLPDEEIVGSVNYAQGCTNMIYWISNAISTACAFQLKHELLISIVTQ